MKIVCFGDSLTEGDYGVFGKSGIANVQKENYPYFLSKEFACEVVNRGHCGFRPSASLERFRAGEDPAGADVILLLLGTNGGLDPDADTAENAAYLTLLDELAEAAPNAALVLLTPPHATSNPAFSNCGYAPQAEKAAAFVRAVAAAKGLPLVDLAACPAFTAETEAVYQANDGLHFVEAGYRVMASFIAAELRKLSVI